MKKNLSIRIDEITDADAADLERISRAILCARYNVSTADLDVMLEADTSAAAAFDAIMDEVAADPLIDDAADILLCIPDPAYKPIHDHLRFMDRVRAGDPKAVEQYRQGIQWRTSSAAPKHMRLEAEEAAQMLEDVLGESRRRRVRSSIHSFASSFGATGQE